MTALTRNPPRNAHSKASSPEEVLKLLTRLSNHFRSERSEAEWRDLLIDYAGLLSDLPPDITLRAINNLGRTLRWFPKASEIRDEAYRLIAAAPKSAQPGDEPLHVRLDKEAKRYVKSFMQGDLGWQAKDEGWRDLLSGWMLSATYAALLKAHQTNSAPDLPTTVPTHIIDSYRRMRPKLTGRPRGEAGEGESVFRDIATRNTE